MPRGSEVLSKPFSDATQEQVTHNVLLWGYIFVWRALCAKKRKITDTTFVYVSHSVVVLSSK